jgi:hypothetical protein
VAATALLEFPEEFVSPAESEERAMEGKDILEWLSGAAPKLKEPLRWLLASPELVPSLEASAPSGISAERLEPSDNALPLVRLSIVWLLATLSTTFKRTALSLSRPIILVGSMKKEETSFDAICHSLKASWSPAAKNCCTWTKS